MFTVQLYKLRFVEGGKIQCVLIIKYHVVGLPDSLMFGNPIHFPLFLR